MTHTGPYPNPWTCEHVTLLGKRDSADEIKVKDLLHYLSTSNLITSVLRS